MFWLKLILSIVPSLPTTNENMSILKLPVAKVKPTVVWNNYNILKLQLTKQHQDLTSDLFLLNTSLDEDIACNPTHVAQKYLFFRKSSITSFFSTNLVDMPICFKKSKSLYNTTFEIPLFKFLNLLMRRGQRTQTLKFVTKSFDSLFLNLYLKYSTSLLNWTFVFRTFYNRDLTNSTTSAHFINLTELNLTQKTELNERDYTLFPQTVIFQKFLTLLENYFPIFSFFVRRVNKDLRKNSRGKSGKYMIVWKYVPTYKRLYITMRWFLKDLKFQKPITLEGRLYQILESLFLTPELLFLHKVRQFTHRYVFKHFKKTLLRTLKSV